MPLPSFLTRKPKPAPAAEPDRSGDDGPAIEAARTRARRRLVGAVVLLAAGVVGFPLIFETQPRPIAVDIPIEAPRREPASAPTTQRTPPPRPVVAEAPAEPEPAAAPASATAPAPAPAPVVAPAPKPTTVADAPKPAPATTVAAAPPPAASAAVAKADDAAKAKAEDAARAKALLDGAAASAAKGQRFIVQVGAYTDAASVKEARAKVEKLGMTSYTQVIDADGTKRTRVRVGPFPSRQEADSAGARLKSAGLPVHILTL